MGKKTAAVRAEIIKSTVRKAETPQNINPEEHSLCEWIPQPPLKGLEVMTENSSILPQCIAAYKANIAGFGIGVRYKGDFKDTAEYEQEFERLEDIVQLLTLECDTKEIFESLVEMRETYGIAYLEVIRNGAGQVVGIELVEDVPSVEKTIRQEQVCECSHYYKGQLMQHKKRFRKYRQLVNGRTVYFKEFGDKRVMNLETGEYSDNVPYEKQANELLEVRVGTKPYGQVRWIGQAVSIDGSRKAENLNNNYFENGRHTPLAVVISGGTLTSESYSKLQTYMNDIKGEAGQHSFLLLEADSNAQTEMEGEKPVDIRIENLAGMLQHDELFQDYLDNNRRKVQSSFRLPDLYVGYTTDFNRATAQTAMEVTEKQVFQPERQSLAWLINNKLLSEYCFEHVEVYFKEPDITNPDDLYRMLSVCANAGGLTPNKAKEVAYNALGEVSDDYEGDWGNIPIAYSKTLGGLDKQISKAAENHDDEVVAVMKSVRALLIERGGA